MILIFPGIHVSSTPIAVNAATADVALFLMLGALRRIHVPYNNLRQGKWRGPDFQLGYDPNKKVLGILGMGGIGRDVATRARAFGMSIQYHNRSQLSPELEQGAKYVSFEELLKTSDVLSLNCSLRKETVHIIGKKEFDQMKKGVVLVNTARGKLIDEQALVDALNEGKVFSAGLDVFEEEPKIHEGLLNNPNVVLLPHIGTATWETQASHLPMLLWIRGHLLTLQSERHGAFGAGEFGKGSQDGQVGHSGARADEQLKIVNEKWKFWIELPPQ
jgi:D-3-phosphoglycerate dehydrogenase